MDKKYIQIKTISCNFINLQLILFFRYIDMNLMENEPASKKPKSDDSKCCICERFFRKGNIKKKKTIQSKEDALSFTKKYNMYVSVGEIICNSCYSKITKTVAVSKACVTNTLNSTQTINHETNNATQFVNNQRAESSNAKSFFSNSSNKDSPFSTDIVANSSIAMKSFPQKLDKNSQGSTNSQSSLNQVDSIISEPPVPSSQSPISQRLTSQISALSSETTVQSESSGSSWEPPKIVPETETIVMPFKRVCFSKAYCFICKTQEKLRDVPFQARIQVFVQRRLFIPKRNRCCLKHLIGKKFYEDEIDGMVVFSDESVIDADEIKKFLDQLTIDVGLGLHDKIGGHSISDERIKALTGHTWETINVLKDMMKA